MSPLLFALFLNDMPAAMAKPGRGIKLLPAHPPDADLPKFLSHIEYADDVVLCEDNVEKAQSALDDFGVYSDSKDLFVNVPKCAALCFNPNSPEPPVLNLTYKGQDIPQVRKFKYLGMLFLEKLNLLLAAKAWSPAMFAALKSLRQAAGEKGLVQMPHVLLHLYQSYVLPRAMYASQVWSTNFLMPGKALACPLQSQYLSFIRHIFHVGRSVPHEVLLSEACQKSLQFYWLRGCAKLWCLCIESNSPLLRAVCHSEARLSGHCTGSWAAQVGTALHAWQDGLRIVRHAAPVPVNIPAVEEAWRKRWHDDWRCWNRNPAFISTSLRLRATFAFYFRNDRDLDGRKYLHDYLTAGPDLPPPVVNSMTRFRLGSHNLRVRAGRHDGLEFKDRTCLRCAHADVHAPVDTEHHLLFDCAATAVVRSNPIFRNLLRAKNIRSLFAHENTETLAIFIHKCMRIADRPVGAPDDSDDDILTADSDVVSDFPEFPDEL
jgi:hypothetical protein